MPDTVAYTAKARHDDPDQLGRVNINDRASLDLREALADGPYVTSDPDTIVALDRHPGLKRVAVPDTNPEPEPQPEPNPSAGTVYSRSTARKEA